MDQRPIIGLMPLYDDEQQGLWMLPNYYKMVREAGGIPVILSLGGDQEEWSCLYEMCDGLLFTGGHDVDPEFYESEHPELCGTLCVARDNLETYMFLRAWRDEKPVLGVCRGMQLINVLLGGDLYEDLPTQLGNSVCHKQEKPYTVPGHKVRMAPPLSDLLGTEIGVNTLHHQGVRNLSPKLRVMARTEDDLIEAFFAPARDFLWGVQWHPEYLYETEPKFLQIMSKFITSCIK